MKDTNKTCSSTNLPSSGVQTLINQISQDLPWDQEHPPDMYHPRKSTHKSSPQSALFLMYHPSRKGMPTFRTSQSFLTEKASSILTTLLMINFINPTKKTKTKTLTKSQIELCRIKIDFLANWSINLTLKKRMHLNQTKILTKLLFSAKSLTQKPTEWSKPLPRTSQV